MLDAGGHDTARAVVRDERHRFPPDPGRPRGCGPERHGLQYLGQDDPHLEGGEGGPQAAPDAAAEAPVVYLHGPEPHLVSPLDFRQTSLLIETSYEAARAFLADLDITGPGLYGSP